MAIASPQAKRTQCAQSSNWRAANSTKQATPLFFAQTRRRIKPRVEKSERAEYCATSSLSQDWRRDTLFASAESLELPNACLRRTGKNIQAYARRGYRRKAVDLLMSEGMTFNNRLPAPTIPNLDSITLDVLTIVQPFHY